VFLQSKKNKNFKQNKKMSIVVQASPENAKMQQVVLTNAAAKSTYNA